MSKPANNRDIRYCLNLKLQNNQNLLFVINNKVLRKLVHYVTIYYTQKYINQTREQNSHKNVKNIT